MSALAAAVRYRSLVDRLGAIVWEAIPGRKRGHATFTFVSEGTETLLGFTSQRWTESPTFWFEMIHSDDRDRVNAAMVDCAVNRTPADFEYRAIAANGREIWLRNIVQVDETTTELRLAGVLVDITDRKEADARLHRLQEVTDALSGLLDARAAADVIATQSRAATGALAAAVFLKVTDDELEISAYDGHPGEGDDLPCRVPLDRDVPAAEVVRTGEAIVIEHADATARYPGIENWRKLAGTGLIVALPLAAEDRVLGSIVLRLPEGRKVGAEDLIVLDVLERASVSALLRAEQGAAERDWGAVLDTIITQAPEAFALFDTSLRYVRVNEALAEMHGLPATDHVGRVIEAVVPGSAHADALRQVLQTGEPIVEIEVTGVAVKGSDDVRTWLASYYPVTNAAGGIAFLGKFMLDITDRKRAEERSQMFGELATKLDAEVTVEARMGALVRALVPDVCDFASIELRVAGGDLERIASRGTAEPTITVPLLVRGRDLGALALAPARPGIASQDRAFATEVARRAGLAIDNARLYEAERVARERTAAQYGVAAALAEALDPADVARATLETVTAAVGVEHGTMWQLNDDGTMLELIGQLGYDAPVGDWSKARLDERRPIVDTLLSRESLWIPTPEELDARYPDMAPVWHRAGIKSTAVFPLSIPGRTIGVLLLSAERAHALTTEDRALIGALAAQSAQALERARLFEAERLVSVTLQRSLLPAALPEVAGIDIDVRYVPAAGLEAGGDFYEAIPLPDGSLIVAVGDVVGRGASAAAAMGQLRSALRAYALSGEEPGALLTRLSAFADTVSEAMAATAVVAKIDTATGRMRYACAGHPWPVLAHAAAPAELLMGGRGVPLGCLPEPNYPEDTVILEPGATLLLYTDGLTERRGEDMDGALSRLSASMTVNAKAPLPGLLDRAVEDSGTVAPADDVALVALRYTGSIAAQRVELPAVLSSVPAARHAVRDWLAEMGVSEQAAADVLLAAGEAIANAVEHASATRVAVEMASPTPGSIRITIRDDGAWKSPVVSPHRGRGFGLMRALMDTCAVQRSPDGTVVKLAHRVELSGAPVVLAQAGDSACTVFHDGRGHAVLTGELDLACSDEVSAKLQAADLISVDLTGVSHLDSTGARMLFELPARPVFVAPPGSAARRTLDVSSLTGVMNVSDAPPA